MTAATLTWGLGRRLSRRTAARCWWLVALLLGGVAAAQSGSATVELGLGGQLVAGAWNPLQVTVRDAAASTLRVRIDEGSLLEGPRIVRYSASVPGGSGITVFDDVLYVPPFRTLSWTLVSDAGVLASGSLGSGASDPRPLQLVLSSSPGRWRSAFGVDARLVDVPASGLPERAAAYDGVDTLLLDGSAAAPRAEAIAAAAAGGAQVLLAGTLPASQAGLERLAGSGAARVGAGLVVRLPADPARVARARAAWTAQDRRLLVAALASRRLLEPPRSAGQPLVLALAAAYVLVALLALRFGGAPGLAAGLVLALLVSVAGWRLLRPPEAVLSASSSVLLGGGELALDLRVDERLTLPAGVVTLPVAGRPLSPVPYAVRDGVTRVELPRWQSLSLAERPTLRAASLRYRGARLVNAGAAPLHPIYVLGLGRQADLAPGASLTPAPGEDGPLPPLLASLARRLPVGTALAEAPASPRTVWVALPPPATANGGER